MYMYAVKLAIQYCQFSHYPIVYVTLRLNFQSKKLTKARKNIAIVLKTYCLLYNRSSISLLKLLFNIQTMNFNYKSQIKANQL